MGHRSRIPRTLLLAVVAVAVTGAEARDDSRLPAPLVPVPPEVVRSPEIEVRNVRPVSEHALAKIDQRLAEHQLIERVTVSSAPAVAEVRQSGSDGEVEIVRAQNRHDRLGPHWPLARIFRRPPPHMLYFPEEPAEEFALEVAEEPTYRVYLKDGHYVRAAEPPRFRRRVVVFAAAPAGTMASIPTGDVDRRRTLDYNRRLTSS